MGSFKDVCENAYNAEKHAAKAAVFRHALIVRIAECCWCESVVLERVGAYLPSDAAMRHMTRVVCI